MRKNTNREIGKNWDRVKQRLRSELGEEVYSSWFGRVEPECLNEGLLQLSVPTKFLQKWLQSHYATRVLDTCKAELSDVSALEFLVRGPNSMMNINNANANNAAVANAAAANGGRSMPANSNQAPSTAKGMIMADPAAFRASKSKNGSRPAAGGQY